MKQEFTAIIQQVEGKNAAFIEPPFDINEIYGAKRVKVKATFDGIEYRGSIVSMGGCYMLGMTQDIRKKINKGFGEEVAVTVEKDEEERTVEMPEDLSNAMRENNDAATNYEKLSFSAKKKYVTWITSAKKQETRDDRVVKAVAMLAEGKKL